MRAFVSSPSRRPCASWASLRVRNPRRPCSFRTGVAVRSYRLSQVHAGTRQSSRKGQCQILPILVACCVFRVGVMVLQVPILVYDIAVAVLLAKQPPRWGSCFARAPPSVVERTFGVRAHRRCFSMCFFREDCFSRNSFRPSRVCSGQAGLCAWRRSVVLLPARRGYAHVFHAQTAERAGCFAGVLS